ncbi:MAG: SprB repeat-containing protein [Marinilabiliaceae bacterium]|nr:SprB repeat-containing protein [Marinilabiliaceae bacterium]
MRKGYFIFIKKTALLFVFCFFLQNVISGQSRIISVSEETNDVECRCSENCFSSEIIDELVNELCLTRTIQVTANNCKYALSHLIIEVPCGIIADANNSNNWELKLNSKDPKSGIWGLKVDDIEGFGDGGIRDSFTVTYTVCASNVDCFEELRSEPFVVAYKASVCLYVDTLKGMQEEKLPLLAEISANNILCNGTLSGSVSVDVLQGTEPYSFLWNTGDTTQVINQLAAGLYSVIITDFSGQTIELSSEVLQPEKIIVSGLVTKTSCSTNNGSIALSVSGGVEPYTVLWCDGKTSYNREGLGIGDYRVTVTDANGCVVTNGFKVSQASNIFVTISSKELECFQDGQGELITTVGGGVGTYSYEWSTGDTTANLYNLTEGRYQITVTDEEGCNATRSGSVSVKNIVAAVSAKSPACSGGDDGSATLVINNGTAPYDILWSNGDTSVVAENLSSGTYNVSIRDVNGCEFSRVVLITEPDPVNISTQIIKTDCSSDSSGAYLVLAGSGGQEPYRFFENNNEINDTIFIEVNGIRLITIEDANNCSSTHEINVVIPEQTIYVSAIVTQPSCYNNKGSIMLSVKNGTEPYETLWDDGFVGLKRDEVEAGDYAVTVTDASGCIATTTFVINKQDLPEVNITSYEQPYCNSDGNIIIASTYNVSQVIWDIMSENGEWYIEDTNGVSLFYHAGIGNATIIIQGISDNGCVDTDTIIVSCNNKYEDANEEDDSVNIDYCDFLKSFSVKSITNTGIENGCLFYKMVVFTDGQSEHDLSHMVVGVKNGWIDKAVNSENWQIDMNGTDPKSGVYGFKIDGIEGFGQDGYEEFYVDFTVCYNGEVPSEVIFPVIFKAATCSLIDTIIYRSENNEHCFDVKDYPNPFDDDAYIEFDCYKDTHVDVTVYDACGSKVEVLFDSDVRKGDRYKCRFSGRQYKNQVFFYRISTPEETRCGKIIKR